MRVVPILATSLCVIGLAACGGGGGPSDLGGVPTTIVVSTTEKAAVVPAPATPQTVLPAYASLVARAQVAKLAVYDEAGRGAAAARVHRSGRGRSRRAKVAQVFLVESQRDDGWVKVLLPVSPAGTTGWVHDSDVTITQVVYRMRVELAAGRLTVFSRGKERLRTVPIAIDAAARATKPAHYYLRASFTAPTARMTASPFVYALPARLVAQIPLGTPVDVARRRGSRSSRRRASGQSANAARGSAYVFSSITLPLGSAIFAFVCSRSVPAYVGVGPLQPLRRVATRAGPSSGGQLVGGERDAEVADAGPVGARSPARARRAASACIAVEPHVDPAVALAADLAAERRRRRRPAPRAEVADRQREVQDRRRAASGQA